MYRRVQGENRTYVEGCGGRKGEVNGMEQRRSVDDAEEGYSGEYQSCRGAEDG